MTKKILVLILLCFLFFACKTDDAAVYEAPTRAVPEVTAAEPVTEPVIIEEPEPVSAEVLPEEPEAEPEPEPDQDYSEEYLRSIGSLSQQDAVSISPEVFEDDKNQIFEVINDLDRIMKKKDFNAWVAYLTPESYEYWSNRHNLLELSRYLFSSDDFHFNTIREYFEMFFIPARRGRLVDEIRYVTPTYVKVVQYKNKTDIIYYFFEKHDDKWLLQLDTL